MVSIVVPIYNVENYLEDCCLSIEAQEYKDIEVIFVDDCSTDNSMKILNTYLHNHTDFPTHKIIKHEHNRGLSATRNTGLKTAIGKYVLFLDSDDMFTPSAISDLVKAIKDADIAMGSVQIISEKGELLNKYQLEDSLLQDTLKAYAKGEWYVMAWNKLCSRQFLLDHNLCFEDGLLHEDMLWSLQLACAKPKTRLIDKVTYLYRQRQTSIMTSMSIEKDLQVHVHVFCKMKDFILSNGLDKEKDIYTLVEGKKSQVLYSLLENGYLHLFKQYYPNFHVIYYISPVRAFLSKIISLSYLARDFGYMLPCSLGSLYRRLFYNAMYNWKGKKIKDSLWQKR